MMSEVKKGKQIMKYLKASKDFYTIQLNNKGQYELYFDTHTFKRGDKISCDMCIFSKEHTYIKGEIVKSYKRKIVIEFNYVY